MNAGPFLSSLVSIFGVASSALVYVLYVRSSAGANWYSVAWRADHRYSLMWRLDVLLVFILRPAFFGGVLLAPLVIAFPYMSRDAWHWLMLLAGIAAIIPCCTAWVDTMDVLKDHDAGKSVSDSLLAEKRRIFGERRRSMVLRKALRVIHLFLLELVYGYCAVTYQSLWLAVGLPLGVYLALLATALILFPVVVISALIAYGGLMRLGGMWGRRMSWAPISR